MSNDLSIFSLSGKSILVTGATGYLGRAMSWALAKAGANVLVNSRNRSNSEELVIAIRAAGLCAEPAVFDVTSERDVERYFATRIGRPLSGLINNAYAGVGGTIETAAVENYLNSYEITVTSAHNMLKHSLPGLRLGATQFQDASVINIASMYGVVSPDLRLYQTADGSNPPFYGAAKAALIQWSKYAACEFGAEGIRVNAISPGPFPSESVQKSDPQLIEKLAAKVPMRRIGDAHELGGAVVFLSSRASSFINGANLTVDGGWTAW